MIHCIGDSHSAFFSGVEDMQPVWPDIAVNALPFFKSYRIGPATAYQLHTKQDIIESIYRTVEKEDKIMFCFGEVDCRAHLIKQIFIQNRSIQDLVKECVERYLNAISYFSQNYPNRIIVWGPIASWCDQKQYSGPSYGTNQERNVVTKLFNDLLKDKCAELGYEFISIFYEMLNEDLTTNGDFLEDWQGVHIHLSQRAMPLTLKKFQDQGLT